MEALFSLSVASYEAWLLLLCLIIFIGIYIFDGISFVQRVIDAFTPKPPPAVEIPPEEIIIDSPILVPIAPEEIQAHEEQKIIEAEKEIEAKETERQEIELLEQEKALEEESTESVIQAYEEGAEEPLEITEEEKEEKITDTEDLLSEAITEEKIQSQETIEISGDVTDDETETPIAGVEEAELITPVEPLLDEGEESGDIPETLPTENITGDTGETGEIKDETTTKEYNIGDAPEPTDESILIAEEIEEPKETPEEPKIPETKSETKKRDSAKTERLYAIVNEVKTLIARGNTTEARSLIIEGLSYDKNHRELNLILGSLYEGDRQFQKAEYVYKDLALIYGEDGEILERLGNILIIEKRYDIALEIYKKIVDITGESEGTLYIMTHLVHELGHQEELYAYARRYQKNWPNNPEILGLLAEAEIALGERQAAIQTLIKLKNLTPYNNEIMQTIAQLTMEEELAGNFGRE